MDEATKKRLKKQVRDQERREFLRALPLPIVELEAIFDRLDVELPLHGCDHDRRLTEAWLVERGHDPAPVFAWLDQHGGFCDCEVLANVEPELEDAKKALADAPPG